MSTPVRIVPLEPADRAEWELLALGYKDFYASTPNMSYLQDLSTAPSVRGNGMVRALMRA